MKNVISSFDEKHELFYGSAIIRDRGYIASYDERFYKMFGDRVNLPIEQLVTEEDREQFVMALEAAANEPRQVIASITAPNGEAVLAYISMTPTGRIEEGYPLCKTDIYCIEDTIEGYKSLLKQSIVDRNMLGLYDGMFLVYESDSQFYNIFVYEDGKRRAVHSGYVPELMRRVFDNDEYSSMQKTEMQTFCGALTNATPNKRIAVDAAVFGNPGDKGRYMFTLNPVYDENGNAVVGGIVALHSCINVKATATFPDSAFDTPTGALNKTAIREYAERCIQKNIQPLYIAILDLDDFKSINDSCGHFYGDLVILKTANILKLHIGTRGVVGRFGGDEMMMVFEADDDTEAATIMSTIVRNVHNATDSAFKGKLTASIGVSRYPRDGKDYESLFVKADKAIYVAKQHGKNRFIMYNDGEHGNVDTCRHGSIALNIEETLTEVQKSKFMTSWIRSLNKKGMDAVPEVLNEIRNTFNIEGIALYKGEKLVRFMESGEYTNPIISMAGMTDPVYMKYFDECDWCEVSNMLKIESAPEMYQQVIKQGNSKYIQIIARDESGDIKSVVSFDFFTRTPRFGGADKGLLRIIGSCLADMIAALD